MHTQLDAGKRSYLVDISTAPVPKMRPRLSQRAGHAVVFTPPETVDFEKLVGWLAKAAMHGQPMLQGPLAVQISIFLGVPAKWGKVKKEMAWGGTLRPLAGREVGDVDNYAKSILDGCNGVLWADDKQIVELYAVKYYGIKPSARLRAWEL